MPQRVSSQPQGPPDRYIGLIFLVIAAAMALPLLSGCAMQPSKGLQLVGSEFFFAPDTIVETGKGAAIDTDALIENLSAAPMVFVGEKHTNVDHHQFQLETIKRLHARNGRLVVAMEMFDRTYQNVLDDWSQNRLTEEAFLRRSHWRANWKFNYALYKPILDYLRKEKIRLVGLNIPFHIPRKVFIGGLDSLTPADQRLLPKTIDTTQPDHRKYLNDTFKEHRFHAKANFEYFYEAQCLWEDTMAETVDRHLEDGTQMVVIIGNGHILRHFGVPDRAARRSGKAFKTIYQADVDETMAPADADFIRVGRPDERAPR